MKYRTKFWVTGVLILSAGLYACSGAEEREAKYFKRAQEHYEKDRYEKASVDLKNVLQINPKHVDARYLMALIAEKKRDGRQMFANLNVVVGEKPDHMEAQIKLGALFLSARQYEKALEKADFVLAGQPDNSGGHVLRGSVLFKQGDTAGAEQEAKTALTLKSADKNALMLLARIYAATARSDEALEVLQQGVEKNPDDFSLRILKITLHRNRGEFAEAERDFLFLVKKYPDEASFKFGLARFYVATERVDDAENVLRELVQTLPDDPKPKVLLIEFLRQKRNPSIAESALKKFISETPGDFTLRFVLADFHAKRPEQARKVFEGIVKDDGVGGNGLRARNGLAVIALKEGHYDQARNLVEIVVAEESKNGQALLIRSGLLLNEGEFDAAIGDLRTLLRDEPNSEKALMLLATAHGKNGASALAQEALQRVIEVNPRNLKARQQLAGLFMQSNDNDAAIKLLEENRVLAPDDLATMRALVNLYGGTKALKKAETLAETMIATKQWAAVGHYEMGRILQARNKFTESITEFQKALSYKPEAVEPLAKLIASYLKLGKSQAAIDHLQTIIKDTPKNAFANNLLGEVYLTQNELSKAEKIFRETLEIEPKMVFSYRNLARIYQRRAQTEQAITIYRQGLELLPSQPFLLSELANLYQVLGKYDEAIPVYEELYELQPNNLLAVNNLAALIAEVKTDKKSLQRALTIAEPLRESKHPALLDTYAWLDFQVNQSVQAVSTLETLTQNTPEIPVFHYHLGMAYLATEQHEMAKAELEKAVSVDVEYPGIQKARMMLKKIM